ncbi:hypothetical protein BRD56_08420 [Thermoplasmatales archaeon SW_10_69_26]|jgi:hypothetical protein|nr:MAG: hypothetical protein BRD56_08420 [Thermoplasmatales archaeon SW_10_69_26]
MKVSDRGGQGLEEDAIDLALKKSMEDLKTLLRWVTEAEDPDQALKHIRRSKELLEEMEANLETIADD